MEVVVAMLLMTMLLLGMSAATLSSRNRRITTETKATATNFAQQLLERYQQANFVTEVVSINSPIPVVLDNDLNLNYSYTVQVQQFKVGTLTDGDVGLPLVALNAGETADVKQVTVTVAWGEEDGQRLQVNGLIFR